MKILIISSGFYPVTNNLGGAIENLIETYLIANESKYQNSITLYSIKKGKNSLERKDLKYTEIRIIDKSKIKFKLKRIYYTFLEKVLNKYNGNAYINSVLNDLKIRNELEKYDYVIVENIGRFVPIIKRNLKSKVILHLHNDYLNINTENKEEIVESADSIWCVSEFIANQVRKISPKEEKVKVLYNGINLDDFKKDISLIEKEKLKEKLNISENDFVYIYVGRIMPEKGVKELILAYKKVKEIHDNVKLLIVGGTVEINKNKNKYVKELYKISKEDERSIIFTGKVEHSDLIEYYSIANAQIVPSIWNEAFGLIILEGMSMGIPLIVTKSGGIPEILGKNAIYVERENLVEELSREMLKIIDLKIDKDQLCNEYEKILKKFTKEEYSDKYNEFLES